MKFSMRDFLVNAIEFAGNCGFVKFTEEILNGRLHFLCSDISKTEIKQKTDYIKKKIRLKYQLHTEKI